MSNLTEALRATWTAQEQDREDRDRYTPLVCQCCGFRRKTEDDPECVCAGLDWYMDKGGGVECQAHRFARALGGGKKRFLMTRKV